MSSQIHPAILDAGLQVFGAAVAAEATGTGRRGIYLPTRIDQFRVHGHPGRQSVESRSGAASGSRLPQREKCGSSMKRDVWRSRLTGLRFEYLGEDTPRAAVNNLDDWLYEFQWQPKGARGRKTFRARRAVQVG